MSPFKRGHFCPDALFIFFNNEIGIPTLRRDCFYFFPPEEDPLIESETLRVE